MFTGIVEEVGKLKEIKKKGNTYSLVIEAEKVIEDVATGDSIAVNGVCLTVVHYRKNFFEADVMPETLRNTALSFLKNGSEVNLERALSARGRLGGHFVTGHIDGVGTIRVKRRERNAVWFKITAESSILHYIVNKGSIAVDGISLTVARVENDGFWVSIIPHTARGTTLNKFVPGRKVNLECDILAKYVEKILGGEGDATKNSLLNLLQK